MEPANPVAGTDKTVTIRGRGNFTGFIKEIPVAAKTREDLNDYRISAEIRIDSTKARIYNGEKQILSTDELIVTVKKSGYKPEIGRDYTVRYSNNKNAGTAKVTITGTGLSCNGRVTKTFRISPDKNFKIKYISVDEADTPVYCAKGAASPKLVIVRDDGREVFTGLART